MVSACWLLKCGTESRATECVNASTISILFKFPSEEGGYGPFVPNCFCFCDMNFVLSTLFSAKFVFDVEQFFLVES